MDVRELQSVNALLHEAEGLLLQAQEKVEGHNAEWGETLEHLCNELYALRGQVDATILDQE
jgi:hypothetical protein